LKTLAPPDTHHLRAAEGWLELGNPLEAEAELDNITLSLRTHPDVLSLRWQIFARAQNWEACVELAEAIVAADPRRPDGWIHRSFALHELKRTREAHELLEPAANLFSDNWTIRYNLACYACQLGNLDEARERLAEAIAVADSQEIKQMARNDKDLQPLWEKMGEI
jgi:tetratricopeptide (TPR) repeat protein